MLSFGDSKARRHSATDETRIEEKKLEEKESHHPRLSFHPGIFFSALFLLLSLSVFDPCFIRG
jgi:hypothetical protein